VIAESTTLFEFLEKLAPFDRIGLDTEADSLHCYFEKLCLIQISIPGHHVLIDPLSEMPKEPLWSAILDKELVLHGMDFDIRMLRRAGHFEVRRVFDTMIAARLIGIKEFSLAALILRYFGVSLAKGSQKANWARRPLQPQMAEYAVNDTRYLLELSDILQGELKRLERLDWFDQICRKTLAMAHVNRERDIDSQWRITGSAALRGRESAILRELWLWRDEEARRSDRPPFHILQNSDLIEASRRVHRGDSVFYKHLRGSRLERFQEAIEKALQLPEELWPKYVCKPRVRPSLEQQRLFAEFKARRDKAAEKLEIDPTLIASKAVMEALAENPEEGLSNLLPWQRGFLENGSL
jgi:ribonuclease D